MNRVVAVKGVATANSLVGTASPVDINAAGKRRKRGYKMWPVGVGVAKSELYGWLKLDILPDSDVLPRGYCHFPEYDKEFFLQLTAEHLVEVRNKKTGFMVHEWRMIAGRENHWLDTRVYARAAASVLGIDQVWRGGRRPRQSPPKRTEQRAEREEFSRGPEKRVKKSGWLKSGGRKPGGWMSKRRS